MCLSRDAHRLNALRPLAGLVSTLGAIRNRWRRLLGNHRHVFLSYPGADVGFALRLAADLKNRGVDLWVDCLDVQPGDDRVQATKKAADNAAALIALLSPEYVVSQSCQLQLVRARRKGCTIIPVLLRPLAKEKWPVSIERRQLIDFSAWTREDIYRERLDQLIQRLSEKTPSQLTNAPGAEARYLTCLLKRVAACDHLPHAAARPFKGRYHLPQPGPGRAWLAEGQFEVLEGKADTSPPFQGRISRFSGIRAVAEKHPRFVLVGPPGSGKTAILHHLAFEAAQLRLARPRTARLPLFLNLADWADGTDPRAFVRSHFPFVGDAVGLLARGRAVLYLDGLSETGPAAAEKARLLQEWLHSRDAPQHVVITCRSEDYQRELLLDLPTVQAKPWNAERIRQFLEHYLGGDSATTLLARLESGQGGHIPRLPHLAHRPDLLHALALTSHTPPEEAGAYSVGVLLQRWVDELWQRQAASADITFETLAEALSELAYAMIRDETPVYVSSAYATEHIGLPSLLCAENSGHFLQVESGQVRFKQQHLQDYFAALRLQREEPATYLAEPKFDLRGHRIVRKWDAAIVILSGLVPEPDAFVREVCAVNPFLALECVLSGLNIAATTREQAVHQVLNTMFIDGRDGRVAAARLLGEVNPELAMRILLDTMRDVAWEVRWAATAVLRELRLPLLPGLTEAINNLDQKQRDVTAAGLRQLGEAALPTLIQLLHDENWFTRRSAAWALGEIGDAAGVPALVEALHDRESLVSADAAMALGWIRDQLAIPWLQQLLHHPNWRIRKAGARALGWIGAPAVEVMLEELRSGNGDVHRLVVEALKNTHDRAVLDILLEATYDVSAEVRSAAVEALENVEGDVFLRRLIQCLADTARARWQKLRICDIAANILEASGKPEAVAAVEEWRRGAADSHRAGGGTTDRTPAEEARDRLKTTLTQPEPGGEPLPPAELVRDLHGPDWSRRRGAVLALRNLAPEVALPALKKALHDEDNQVRVAAVKALGRFDTDSALQALIQALSDDDYLVCDAASEALKTRGRQAVPYLLSALRSPKPNVRGAAIEALGKIADPSTVPDLIACLSDVERPWLAEQRICDLAAHALNSIGTVEALQAVLQWRAANAPAHNLEAATESTEGAPQRSPEKENGASRREILPALLENLHHTDWAVRQDAAKGVREYARQLQGTRDSALLQQMLEALNDPDWVVRWAIAEALAWLGDPEAVPGLIECLTDASAIVRVAVIRALVEIGDKRAVQGLEKALADPDKLVREAAAEALGDLGDPTALPALAQAMNDPEPFVRLAVVEAVGKLEDDATVPTLVQALEDKDDHVRWAAVIALGRGASVAAVPALSQCLHDTDGPYWEDKRICDVAAEALEHIGTPEARAALAQWRSQQEASV